MLERPAADQLEPYVLYNTLISIWKKMLQFKVMHLEGQIHVWLHYVYFIPFKLGKAHCELNKRIYEHDKCLAEGKMDKRDVTLQVCDFSETVYSYYSQMKKTPRVWKGNVIVILQSSELLSTLQTLCKWTSCSCLHANYFNLVILFSHYKCM